MAPEPEVRSPHRTRSQGPAAIALFGGAFNPPHRAHERIAKAVLTQLEVARLIVLPAGRHPWKAQDPELAPPEVRCELARLAFDFDPRIEVDDYEQRLAGPSYTVDTLRHFRATLPSNTDLYWLIGSDNVADFPKWHEARAILGLAKIAIYPRAGHPIGIGQLPAQGFDRTEIAQLLAHPLAVNPEATSSSAIRRALARGEDVGELLAPPVLARIRAAHLYGT